MALVYVSYKSEDWPFVQQVVERLKARHEIAIDAYIPIGEDWRSYMQRRLQEAEVFVVFASGPTRTSVPPAVDGTPDWSLSGHGRG
jgi:hypothetical protein